MIFISTGTIYFPFKRLINQVINYYQNNNKEIVIIQSGSSKIKSPAKHIIIKQYFSLKQTIKYLQKANLIISAAGEASVFLTLKHSKNIPIFIPRLKKFKEHVDDQQLIIGKFLQKYKLANVITNISQLKMHIEQEKSKNINNKSFSQSLETKKLIKNLNKITK